MTSRSGIVVVVGVSRTSSSPRALRFAVAEAAAHGGSVIAVRAWKPSVPTASGTHLPLQTYDPQEAFAAELERLREDVSAVLERSDDVECRVVEGGRRKVLLEQARAADLLVLDAPRQVDLSGGAIFAHRLVYSTPCPVVIMPPADPNAGHAGLGQAGRRLGEEILRAAGTAGRPGVRAPYIQDEAPPDEGPRV